MCAACDFANQMPQFADLSIATNESSPNEDARDGSIPDPRSRKRQTMRTHAKLFSCSASF
jgi:hypothetical protein